MSSDVSNRNSVVDASEYVSLCVCVHVYVLKERLGHSLNNFELH